eukprot:193750-Pleurochrysis_carterae.AAC.1
MLSHAKAHASERAVRAETAKRRVKDAEARAAAAFTAATRTKLDLEARSISHWSPYDRVRVVNADP